jgi:DNA-binding transcriptional LysR family regulator
MEHRQLRHFLAIFEERNFTRAAKRCNISQQGLSYSIRQLETELGVPLFFRSPSGIDITEFGRVLYRSARGWLDHHSLIVEEIRGLREKSSPRFVLALAEGYSDIFPEGFFRDFLLSRDGMIVDIACFPADICQESMVRQGICLGFSAVPINTAVFEILHSWRDRVLLVAGENHPLAGKGSVSLKDLRNESVIILNNQRHPQPAIMKLCADAGIRPSTSLGASDPGLYRELCMTGRFVSFWSGPVTIPGLVGIHIDEFENLHSEISLIRNRNAWLSPAAEAFIAWTEKKFPGPVPPEKNSAGPAQ